MINIAISNKLYQNIFDLTTVEQYLKLNDSTDNNILSIIIDYATTYAQNITSRLIYQDIYDIKTNVVKDGKIEIIWQPITTINSVVINGVNLTNGIDYQIQDNFIILLNSNGQIQGSENIYDINVLGGYVSLSSMPADLRMAILMHISSVYDNRNGNAQSIPAAISNIYNKIARIRLSFHDDRINNDNFNLLY